MADAKPKLFIVTPKVQRADAEVKPRLIRGERRSQVENLILGELNITEASAEDAHAAAGKGVEIESALPTGTTSETTRAPTK